MKSLFSQSKALVSCLFLSACIAVFAAPPELVSSETSSFKELENNILRHSVLDYDIFRDTKSSFENGLMVCDNVTDAGAISAADPSTCGPLVTVVLESSALPSGGSGTLQYIWLRSLVEVPNIVGNTDWEPIPDSDSPNLTLNETLTETTYFIRCARRSTCSFYAGESNVVEVLILPGLEASCALTAGDCGENNSEVAATISGGVSPFAYAWNTGATSATISGLPAGNYSVAVTDANGCTGVCGAEVPNLLTPAVVLSCEPIPGLSFNGLGEAANTNSTCVDGPYAFWSGNLLNNRTSQKHWEIVDGTFNEYDNNTAVLTGTVVNRANDDLSFEVNVFFSGKTVSPPAGSPKENSVCVGDLDNTDWYYYTQTSGTLSGTNDLAGAEISIARFGESFQIGTGANLNQGAEFGASGWVEFFIMSQPTNGPNFGSTQHGDFNFALPTGPGLLDVPTPCASICAGESIDLYANVLIGNAATYTWSNGGTGNFITISPTETTTYTVEVTGANGCSTFAEIEIFVTLAPTVTLESTNPSCEEGGTDGSIAATASGGSEPYTYLWSNDQTTASVSGLAAGTYSVTVTDSNGCVATQSATISAPAPPLVAVECGIDPQPLSIFSLVDYVRSCSSGADPVAAFWTNNAFDNLITEGAGCSNNQAAR